MSTYRNLTKDEITQLERQNCSAEAWSSIQVKEKFSVKNIKHVTFSGSVKLGILSAILDLGEGLQRPAGIINTSIHNCTIDDDVYIAHVGHLANYQISNHVVIDNVNRLIVDGETTFGSGAELDVFNEGGGREVVIFDGLTAQIAYMMAAYRHDQPFIDNLKKLIDHQVQKKKAVKGLIGEKAKVINCKKLINVQIGAFATINGANHLENGTIISNSSAPSEIGSGVIAKTFIILSGSKIKDAALLDQTFIGQGVQIGKQFSAENSLIFANSECFHSEACSLFAGPYTVTHHKSTLLIAGMFSFYNAGSGSNQSNHMYKLGPIHQGILERGSKTGSFSYMLWPSRVGAFSVVIGKHYANFDNSELPFSYILESAGRSLLIPAMNFFTVGTRRDSSKWPKRDRRSDSLKMDLINFDLLTPYLMAKVLRALQVLQSLMNSGDQSEKLVSHKGLLIERKRLAKAKQDYQLIIDLYLGEQLLQKLESLDTFLLKNIISELSQTTLPLSEKWVDLFGMITPLKDIVSIMSDVNSGKLNSIAEFTSRLNQTHNNYAKQAWKWYLSLLYEQLGKKNKQLKTADLIQVLKKWESAIIEINKRILDDAGKEFSDKSRIGYGIDGDQQVMDADFEGVIGTYNENKFIKELKEEIQQNSKRVAVMIDKLQALS